MVTFHRLDYISQALSHQVVVIQSMESTNTLHTITNGINWPLLNDKKHVICCEELHFLLFPRLHINSLHIFQTCMQNMTKINIFGKCLW